MVATIHRVGTVALWIALLAAFSYRKPPLTMSQQVRELETVNTSYDEESDVTVVSPGDGSNNSLSTLAAWCRDNQQFIRQLVFAPGGLLLRDWEIATVHEAEELIFEHMGFPPMETFPQTFLDFSQRATRLGVPPGGLTQTKYSRNVPAAQKGTMQEPHVEFGLGPNRPRVVSFFVEEPPAVDGSTARVFFPAAVQRLSPELYRLLSENGWWNPLAGTVQPSILIHPETQMETLQLWSFSRKLASTALEAYVRTREKRRRDNESSLPFVSDIPYAGQHNYEMVLVQPNGTRFVVPHELQVEYYEAIFSTVRLQHWQKGDLLLFDNVLYGHFRMPGEPPRRLHGIFAQNLDTRTLHPPDAPECVAEAAQRPAKRATQAILDQIGTGGNLYVRT